MRTVRVLVLVAVGVSAFCGFAQEAAPGTGAPAGGAVMLNRTKAAPAKPEIVPADKYPFEAIQKALEQGPGADIESAARKRRTWSESSSWVGAVGGCRAVGDGA